MSGRVNDRPRKIAVVGTGIAGSLAAHRLSKHHQVTVFEADNRVGGHTNTVDVSIGDRQWAVDTGFIVFNDWTYPHFIDLLDELGVDSQASDMSFSVRCERTGLEYNGASLNALFAQRSNLLRPRFYRMLREILRFNREAPAILDAPGDSISLGEYLDQNHYSTQFIEHYIVPMGAAIWSATPGGMERIPARFFVQFFTNHGLLNVKNRPTWRVIRGGSRTYMDKLVAGHRDRIRLNCAVQSIRRFPDHVEIKAGNAPPEKFDQVFLACHSDQALAMLADPTPREQSVLGAIRYQRNEAILHTDASLMPKRRLAWAAWNYHVPAEKTWPEDRVALTYNMNILQGLQAPVDFCVTLNYRQAIDPAKIIQSIEYMHPIFTEKAVNAQQHQRTINGASRTYYCGAYWRNGFHEDGVVSTMNALAHFNDDQAADGFKVNEKQYLSRAG